VLFDLGLGGRVVGVTNFCRFPPEVKSIPAVGGLYDVNIERVVAHKPTHVFMLKENAAAAKPLEVMKITPIIVDHSSVKGIKQSYSRIAEVCGVTSRAEQRLQSFADRERELQQRCVEAQPTPSRKTMVVVGRIREGNQSSGIYISGKDGFYSDVLRLVGAENVNSQHTVAVPAVSAEGIMKLAPEVIIEVVNADDHQVSGDRLAFWQQFSKVPAVKSKKVFVLSDDFASIPGPRYIILAAKLSSILCPP
jgi:iron complex transport system substrate-binding protein